MKKTYSCEWCDNQGGSGWDTPDGCLKHEAECDYNPANRACATCKHYDWPDTPEQSDKWQHQGDDGDWVTDMGCVAYGDQVWRTQCEKWCQKHKRVVPPNESSSPTRPTGGSPC